MRAWRILPTEDDEDQREEQRKTEDARTAGTAPQPLPRRWTFVLIAIALVPRLFYLFVVSNPENAGDGMYGDVYHHWQIAYMTQQIGLSHFRLWDLKGLEYFWGILHPMLMVILFFVTGSINIILARLLSLVCGVIVVVLVFHLCRRHWGTEVAIASAAFATIAPTSVFNDASGMLEPLGVGLCLLGIWLLPRKGFWGGVAFGLATMARAEAWIFSLGMIVAAFLRRTALQQRLPLLIGWAAILVIYMKILLDQAGNPIYPLYWNFLADAFGKWEYSALTPAEEAVRPMLGLFLAAAAVGLAITLWKRPRSYMFLTFGFGYWVFVAGMLGFTAYLKSWVWWMWITRVFAFPYDFVAILVAIGLFVLAPRHLGRRMRGVGWAVMALALVAVQAAWIPIQSVYGTTQATWQRTIAVGQYLGQIYNQPEYQGGVMNVPPDHASLTYTLARFGAVEGKHLISQLYDPIYYLPAGYSYAGHPGTVDTLMQCWLAKTDTRLLVVDLNNPNYVQLVSDQPSWFQQVGEVPDYRWTIQAVQVPPPSASACEGAAWTTNH